MADIVGELLYLITGNDKGLRDALDSADRKTREHAAKTTATSKRTTAQLEADMKRQIGAAGGAKDAFSALADGLGLTTAGMTGTAAAGGALGIALAATAGAVAWTTQKLFELSSGYAANAVKIGLVNERTGVSVRALSALDVVMGSLGGETKLTQTALTHFIDKIDRARDGSKEAVADLKLFGLTGEAAAKDVTGAFQKVLVEIDKAPPGFEKTTRAARAFGDEVGPKLIPVINKIHGSLDEAEKIADKFGLTLSGQDVAAAKEFDAALKDTRTTLTALGYTLGKEVMPIFTTALGEINTTLQNNKAEWKSWAEYIATTFHKLILDVQSEVNDLRGILDFLNIFNPFQSNQDWEKSFDRLGDRELESKRIEIARQNLGKPTYTNPQDDDYALYQAGRLPMGSPAWAPEPGKTKKAGVKAPRPPKTAPVLSAEARMIIAAADAIGVSPIDYATFLYFEGGGSLRVNHWGGDGKKYLGPMQMGGPERKMYGRMAGVGEVTPQTSFQDYLKAANAYLKDRGVKPGAGLPELYTAINYGNVRGGVRLDARDSNGTIREHLRTMTRRDRPKAEALFKGFSAEGKGTGGEIEAMLRKLSDDATTEYRKAITMSLVESARGLGIKPDEDTIRDYQQILVEDAKRGLDVGLGAGIQPEIEDVQKLFAGMQDYSQPSIGMTVLQRDPLTDQQKFLAGLEEQYQIAERSLYLKERINFEDSEVLARTADYQTALQEEAQELRVQIALAGNRNMSQEALNLFTREQLDQTRALQDVERNLIVLHRQNADEQFVADRRRLAVKQEQEGLERSIDQINDRIVTYWANQGLRVEIAQRQTVLDLLEKEMRAQESLAQSQILLQHQTDLSWTQANAKLMEYLASQKSLTDIVGDAQVAIVDGLGNSVDAMFDRLLAKIGLAENAFAQLVTSIIKDLARLAINQTLKWLFGLAGSFLGGLGGGGGGVGSHAGNISIGHTSIHHTSIGGPMAEGGMVRAQPGGTFANIGEAGFDEYVISTNPANRKRNEALLADYSRRMYAAPVQKTLVSGPASTGKAGNTVTIVNNFHANEKTGAFNRPSAAQSARELAGYQQRHFQ